ncbi:FeoB-associated Cys-rich membrane protein [Paradesertivirga mongoliensis]|uniref:FeoB-associated Cys-rich membrane protein n=1 Tax=Paradesertivirga mongoliensis TaxID=2100740 RepID=A0ABW4ZJJ7_9SPHI|nr:FeoB-associated Cys-rich membrane protein [Pedobacter mongoliensis]
MQIQEILLVLIFTAALFYIGRIVYRNLKSDKGCSSGCGKCGIDFSETGLKK